MIEIATASVWAIPQNTLARINEQGRKERRFGGTIITSLTTIKGRKMPLDDGAITFWYKNYKGDEGYRRVVPISMHFGTSEWHPEKQWLMLGDDTVNGKRREFAMKDIGDVIGSHIISVVVG